MGFLIGILIGFIIGAIALYFAQQNKIKLINQKLKETRRVLDDSEAATRKHAAELEELKQEQEKIRELQTEQKSRQQDLEEFYKVEIEQLRSTAEDKFKEQKNTYQAHLESLLAERQEHLAKIQRYENQIQALEQALNQVEAIPEVEEDFSEALFLEKPVDSEESIEEIESLLDIFSELTAEVEPINPLTIPRQVAEKIEVIAASSKVAAIPQLTQYMYDKNSKVRALVADTFGEIITEKSKGVEIKQLISTLGKLSRDPDPSVRQSAVTALGKVSSINVIPLLKMAQRDTDSNVVKSASAALSKFKGYRLPKKKKALPKNASAKVVKPESD